MFSIDMDVECFSIVITSHIIIPPSDLYTTDGIQQKD